GYKDGEISFELAMDSNANSNIQLTYQLISQMLEEVGIKATIKSYDHAAFIDKRMTGTMDAFIGRWGMDYNDPANIMYTFFGSAQNTKQRSLNYADASIIERVS
ncbi:MAG: ABC transporter substrate-binding protein, partial [Lachnospiraceae bacterium]|nr:ABC transporter substrate-binding protein [Lachnospiraceae bacterium]